MSSQSPVFVVWSTTCKNNYRCPQAWGQVHGVFTEQLSAIRAAISIEFQKNTMRHELKKSVEQKYRAFVNEAITLDVEGIKDFEKRWKWFRDEYIPMLSYMDPDDGGHMEEAMEVEVGEFIIGSFQFGPFQLNKDDDDDDDDDGWDVEQVITKPITKSEYDLYTKQQQEKADEESTMDLFNIDRPKAKESIKESTKAKGSIKPRLNYGRSDYKTLEDDYIP